MVGDFQKVESKLADLKETFERQRVDIRSLQRGQQANSRALEPKVHLFSVMVIQVAIKILDQRMQKLAPIENMGYSNSHVRGYGNHRSTVH